MASELKVCDAISKKRDSGVTFCDGRDIGKIGKAEKVEVVEEVVEVVKIAAVWVGGGNGIDFVVGLVEAGGEAAEKLGHGEVGLMVGDVGRGVEDPGFAVGAAEGVAGPEVAVDEGGEGRLREERVEAVGDMGEIAAGVVV